MRPFVRYQTDRNREACNGFLRLNNRLCHAHQSFIELNDAYRVAPAITVFVQYFDISRMILGKQVRRQPAEKQKQSGYDGTRTKKRFSTRIRTKLIVLKQFSLFRFLKNNRETREQDSRPAYLSIGRFLKTGTVEQGSPYINDLTTGRSRAVAAT